MRDAVIRELERRDAEGDPAATLRLKAELRRQGRDPYQALVSALVRPFELAPICITSKDHRALAHPGYDPRFCVVMS